MENTSLNNIAFLCHPYHRGGVTRWMVDAAHEFSRRNIKTYFITVDPQEFISGIGSEKMVDLIQSNDINVIAPAKNKFFELGTVKNRTNEYVKLVGRNIPHNTPIIISDDYSIWSILPYLHLKYKFIGVLHSDDDAYYRLHDKFGKYLSLCVCVSNRIKEKIKKKSYPVIPCGIVLDNFVPKTVTKDERINLIWIGRIEEKQKRVSDIGKIATLLEQNGIDFNWKILGYGNKETLIKHASFSALEKLTFVGWVSKSEVIKYLGQSDILVLTSNYEGMPVAVMEALSMGVGVVSSRVSGVEDLENDQDSKYSLKLFPIGDVLKATKLIIEMSEFNDNLRNNSAKMLANKYYSIEKNIDEYIKSIDAIRYAKVRLKSKWIGISLLIMSYSNSLALLRIIKFKIFKLYLNFKFL